MNKFYHLILKKDHNVEPSILVFGSLLFDFIKQDFSFNYEEFRNKAKNYYMYSEKNICNTFNWLEKQGFIFYSIKNNEYYVSDKYKIYIHKK